MKILLDECVTKHLKPYLPDHEVSTVAKEGWSGIKNGQLMAVAATTGFEVLLTMIKIFNTSKTSANTTWLLLFWINLPANWKY